MKILTIVKYNLIKLFRDRSALMFTILLPVIFTFIMGSVFGGMDDTGNNRGIPVGFVNLDKSELSKKLMSSIEKNEAINVIYLNKDELYEKVKNSSIEMGFIIPKDMSKKISKGNEVDIKLVKLPQSVDFMAVHQIINNFFLKFNIIEGSRLYFNEQLEELEVENKENIISEIVSNTKEYIQKEDLITVKEVLYNQKTSTSHDAVAQVALGYMIMFVMFTLIFGAGEIVDEIKMNTWGRLNSTPVTLPEIMTGKILGTFFRGWFQVAFLLLFGRFVMSINWGNMFASAIILSIFLLSVTGLGLFLSTIVKTGSQLGAYSSIIIISTTMISGCWWPVELQPLFMQKIAHFLPQFWVMQGLINTAIGNMGVESIILPSLILIIMGGIFYALSLFTAGYRFGLNKIVTD